MTPGTSSLAVLSLMPFSELEVDSATRVDRDGHRLSVIRIGGDLFVLGDRCSHADFSLSEGEVDADEGTIECWKLGSAFNVADGSPDSLPATQPVPVFEATIVDGIVTVTVAVSGAGESA